MTFASDAGYFCVKPHNYVAMLEAAREYGKYPIEV